MALPILPAISRMAKAAKVKIATRPDKRFKRANVKDFKKDMRQLGEEMAEEFKETIISNIETNRYNYPLNPKTALRKGSNIPLVDTHQLVDAIYREETIVSVEDSPRDDSSLTNLDLAIIHEYGTKDKHIPARPIWRDTFRDYKKVAKNKIAKFFKTHKKK